MGLETIKRRVVSYLEYKAIKRHGSRLGRHFAPRYTEYLDQCREAFTGSVAVPEEVERALAEFERKGFTSFWTAETRRIAEAIFARVQEEERSGLPIWDEKNDRYTGEFYTKFPEVEQLFRGPLGAFLRATFRAEFKIFYGLLYRSRRILEVPTGSQLWHPDGGPGTCINVLFYLKDVVKEDGAAECLPWEASVEIYGKELRSREVRRRLEAAVDSGVGALGQREIQCQFYLEEITRSYLDQVEQPTGPAGLVVPFRNNTLHKGGYPEPGRTRYVCLFYCYPSHRPTPFERYRQVGIPKAGSYPADPAAEF